MQLFPRFLICCALFHLLLFFLFFFFFSVNSISSNYSYVRFARLLLIKNNSHHKMKRIEMDFTWRSAREKEQQSTNHELKYKPIFCCCTILAKLSSKNKLKIQGWKLMLNWLLLNTIFTRIESRKKIFRCSRFVSFDLHLLPLLCAVSLQSVPKINT